jgi:hypothetical protein
VFILILVIPLVFLGGLEKTYISSAWTLAYRELNHLPIPEAALPAESGPAQPA